MWCDFPKMFVLILKGFWLILEAILERFCVRFRFVCDLMKTRKIARRRGESIKIEDLRARKCSQSQNKNASEICPKHGSENWSQNGDNLDAKWSQNGGKRAAKRRCFFWCFFGCLWKHRRGRDGASAYPRLSHFLQPTPQGGGILSKNIIQKHAKTA